MNIFFLINSKGAAAGVRACGNMIGIIKFLPTNLKQNKTMVLSIMSRIKFFTVDG